MKTLLLILSLLFIPLTSYAKWRVEKVYDPLFETTTTVISTTGIGKINGESVSIKYSFVIDQRKDITVEIRSELPIFSVHKIEDTTGDALAAVWVKTNNKAEKFYFHVGKTYKFLFAFEEDIVNSILSRASNKTTMRFDYDREDCFDVTFNTTGLKQLIEKYRK